MVGNIEKQHVLNAKQMAQFAVDGYYLFEGIVPAELNRAVHKEMTKVPNQGAGYNNFWNESPSVREVFQLPEVRGIIKSFVGENPIYDHSYLHIVKAQHHKAQNWHGDSIIDTRPFAFDIQAFYFSHDTPKIMGPTLVLPGSHLRRISNFSLARYKNIVGQKQLECKAGSIAILHHAIWHCAQPNYTDTTRYVFKLRLRPGQEQRNLFNTEGCDSPEVRDIFRKNYQPWLGNEARVEHVQRAKLWRYLVGNNSVDVSFEGVLTRMSI